MKVKVRISDLETGRSLVLICNIKKNKFTNRYSFSFRYLSPFQNKFIRKYFGRIKTYYYYLSINDKSQCLSKVFIRTSHF